MTATVLNRILLVLGYAGVLVAGVLSLAELVGKEVPCGMDNGCRIVAQHPSSHLLGPNLPNAYIGFFGYLVLAALATYRELSGIGGPKGKLTINVGYICAAIGTIASIGLTFIAITQIHHTCKWCLASAVIMTATLLVYMLLTIKAEGAEAKPERSLTGAMLIATLAVLCFGGIAFAATKFKLPETTVTPYDPKTLKDLIGPNAHVKNPNGVVTVIEFGDLDCPTCKNVYPHIEQIVENSGGRLRYVFHHFPLYRKVDHPGALYGAMISEMAAEKGKFFDYLDAVYGTGPSDPAAPPPGQDDMINFGAKIGLDPVELRKRLTSGKDPALDKIMADLDLAREYKINVTPSFIVLAGETDETNVQGADIFTVLEDPKYRKLLKGS